jgi:gas vesicle structural protein
MSNTDFAPELRTMGECERASLCELLDRVLNRGVVVGGEIAISVADVDLLYLGLQLVLTSIEKTREHLGHDGEAL